MTKTVYAYDASGKYIGERTLDDTDRSPISGAWQIPGNMTETKPPAAKEGYDLYYKGGKWEQVAKPKPQEQKAYATDRAAAGGAVHRPRKAGLCRGAGRDGNASLRSRSERG